ncbi:MAG: esterase/lipase family protein [Candidatus Hodarchaeota archaeon]
MKKSKKLLIFISFISITCLISAIIPINRLNSSTNEEFYYSIPSFRNPDYRPITPKNGGSNKSLILIHGHDASAGVFKRWNDSSIYANYYNKVVAINYYWDGSGVPPKNYIGNGFNITLETDISNISRSLFIYLKSSNFTEVDFLCHSMGGIVVRDLICNYFQDLNNSGIKIDDVITMGTPNKGSLAVAFRTGAHPFQIFLNWLVFQRGYLIIEDPIASLLISYIYHNILDISPQLIQIRKNSPYIETLKVAGDETPDDMNITWTTIAGRLLFDFMAYFQHFQADFTIFEYDDWERGRNILLLNLLQQLFLWMDIGTDGLVSPRSVKLDGAQNLVWDFESHGSLLEPTSSRKNLVIDILTDKV